MELHKSRNWEYMMQIAKCGSNWKLGKFFFADDFFQVVRLGGSGRFDVGQLWFWICGSLGGMGIKLTYKVLFDFRVGRNSRAGSGSWCGSGNLAPGGVRSTGGVSISAPLG